MKQNRMIHALLAAAVAAGLVLPASAAGTSSFSDVKDPATSVNADILRLMGVADGTGDNRFNPSQKLTRAQFCTMVVNFMGMGDDVVLHSTRTIFTDVPSSHWARGYVNLAASTMLEDGGSSSGTGSDSDPKPAGTPLISGIGDGRFLPDSQLTYAQAVTILIRVLGYSSNKVGAVWPDGYLNLAQSIGLTEGISAGPNAPIDRAQAAQLFVNALSCETGDGKEYYTTLGSAKEDTILLAVNTETDDGSAMGAVRTSNGTYLPDAEDVAPTALVGRRGSLVLNNQSEIVTFVPDDSSAVTISLMGNAEPSYVSAAGGKRYTISGDTPIYTANSEESKSYAEGYGTLTAGSRITLFTLRGKVTAIYAGSTSTAASEDAVVVVDGASAADFHKLTGGAEGYTILKNQQVINMSQIKPYDVVTYDSISNTLIVSDLRLTCRYQNPAPNAKAPQTIELLGHTFPVLESAWDFTGDVAVNQQVVLLLTADGKVAGIRPANGSLRSTAMGVVTGESTANLFLPNGGILELKGGEGTKLSNLDTVCTLSAGEKGELYASRISGRNAPGDFDPSSMTLGNKTVSVGVRVYEQVQGAAAQVAVPLSELDLERIPQDKISGYHENSSGIVDLILLDSVTGDAYTYGLLKVSYDSSNEDGGEKGPRQVALENGSGGIAKINSGYNVKNNSFGGLVLNSSGKIASVVSLDQIDNLSPADFFERDGRYYLSSGGQTYAVATDVECYNDASETWFTQKTGKERFNACTAFSSDLTAYRPHRRRSDPGSQLNPTAPSRHGFCRALLCYFPRAFVIIAIRGGPVMSLFCCPVRHALTLGDHAYTCPGGHSFDLAAAGYVHLLPANRKHSQNPGDDKAMVAARSDFLDRGYYAPLRDALCKLALRSTGDRPAPALLDSGCGEGYYTTALFQALAREGRAPSAAGVDISKFALRRAARRLKEGEFAVASMSFPGPALRRPADQCVLPPVPRGICPGPPPPAGCFPSMWSLPPPPVGDEAGAV